MIERSARLHEVTQRRLADGSRAHFALVSIDEGERLTLRISADEHARLDTALVSKRRFVITLSVAPLDLKDLTGAARADGAG